MNRLIPTSIVTAVFVFTSAIVASRHSAMADYSLENQILSAAASPQPTGSSWQLMSHTLAAPTPTPAAPTPAVVIRNIGGCGDPDGTNNCTDTTSCRAAHGGRGRCKYYEGTEPLPRKPNRTRTVRGCVCVSPLSSPTPESSGGSSQPAGSPLTVLDTLGE